MMALTGAPTLFDGCGICILRSLRGRGEGEWRSDDWSFWVRKNKRVML